MTGGVDGDDESERTHWLVAGAVLAVIVAVTLLLEPGAGGAGRPDAIARATTAAAVRTQPRSQSLVGVRALESPDREEADAG